MEQERMSPEELDKLAYRGNEMPAGLRQPEQMYYLSMRSLYAEYRKKTVDAEQSQREKAEIKRAYETAFYHDEYVKKVEGLWGRISCAAVDYIKHPSLQTAEKFYRTVYNLPENHRKQPIELRPEEGEWEYVLVNE